MRGLLHANATVYLSHASNTARKHAYTWEAALCNGTLVGVNTQAPNRLVEKALEKQILLPLSSYTTLKREAMLEKGTRFDFLLEKQDEVCFVEVKNVHYQEEGVALFPDSVTQRGRKHLVKLAAWCQEKGRRAVVLYLVQRDDCHAFDFGANFDADYAQEAVRAQKKGVEMYAYAVTLSPQYIALKSMLPLVGLASGSKVTRT
jgi:sugar fermentation stimulation protein A